MNNKANKQQITVLDPLGSWLQEIQGSRSWFSNTGAPGGLGPTSWPLSTGSLFRIQNFWPHMFEWQT